VRSFTGTSLTCQRSVQIYFCYGIAIVGGLDNWQRVEVKMPESGNKLKKIFLSSRLHDITLNCSERKRCLKIYSSHHHPLLLPVTKIENSTFLYFVCGIFPKYVTPFQSLRSLFQASVITTKSKLLS